MYYYIYHHTYVVRKAGVLKISFGCKNKINR